MHSVGVLEAKTRLSALLDTVERGGGEVVINRRGRPVAKLVPFAEGKTVPDDIAAQVRAIRAAAAAEAIDPEPFDLDAAINEGRP